MDTLITADQHWALWAVLLSAAAFGLWAERTRWGSRLSGAVIAIGATFVLSNLRVIPVDAPAYDVVWSYFVPLAIPLLLFKANLYRILKEAGPTLIAFAAGAAGTVLGTVAAYLLVPLGPEGYKLAGIFSATYIGGSMNYVAASQALDLKSGTLLTAGVAADNLVMTVYFLVLFALPSISFLRERYIRRLELPGAASAAATIEEGRSPGAVHAAGGDDPGDGSRIRLSELGTALALSAVICAAGYGVARALGAGSTAILVITGVTVALATLFPARLSSLSGASETGTLLMQIFFAVIGASANIGVVLRQGPMLFVFASIILATHLAFLLIAGRLLRLDLAEIIVASNANVGGPTTAAAMATARRWYPLVTPAILCGTLGYAIATFIGTALGNGLRGW